MLNHRTVKVSSDFDRYRHLTVEWTTEIVQRDVIRLRTKEAGLLGKKGARGRDFRSDENAANEKRRANE